MKDRAAYYHRRRQRLRRLRLCTRCGTERHKPGSTLCAACLAIKAIKSAPDPAAARAAKVARLHERLGLIDEARRAVQDELDHVA